MWDGFWVWFYCKRYQEEYWLGEIRYVDKCVDNFLGGEEGGRERLGIWGVDNFVDKWKGGFWDLEWGNLSGSFIY